MNEDRDFMGLLDEESEDRNVRPWGMHLDQYNMLMHLSQLASVIIPLGGIVMPIVMWSTNKDLHSSIDQNGKNILNWIISSVIYFIISFILILVFIGFFTLLALILCSLIFTIMGAVSANSGKVYEYPLTIKFIK